MKNEILLESGTNELEIVIFKVGDLSLGVNVAKVESIITHQKITGLPNTHPNIKGVINHRGRVLPVLDMANTLNKECGKNEQERLLILMYINNSDFVIEISEVVGIKRLSWDQVETPSEILTMDNETPATGVVKLEDEEVVLILDFEKILADMDQNLSVQKTSITSGLEGRKLVVAEDSSFLLEVVNDSFVKAGAKVEKFSNGKDALTYLESVNIGEIYCVITDIEMPVMDGLTLTKNIKENPNLRDIPVILFSSIVSDGLVHKGKSVGADAQITKPEIDKLVSLVTNITKKS
ncbi:chemotaxis protein [Proteinivorax tanatarense]|uniref:Stage 0 sporulation protein A homolog n=1 Tax=Proteinivorax tanatarense TaxID=1260629 RepID=A0AAU7VMV9_9FIRM